MLLLIAALVLLIAFMKKLNYLQLILFWLQMVAVWLYMLLQMFQAKLHLKMHESQYMIFLYGSWGNYTKGVLDLWKFL